MSFRVIALCGAARSGKDTAGHHLKNFHGYGLLKFAGPLKAGLCAMFGWPAEMLENGPWREQVLPNIGKSPRQLMQTLGTDWGRELVHPDLWMTLARQRIDEARAMGLPGVVFTDTRFANEAQLVKDAGGLVIKVVRGTAAPVASHVSESSMPAHLVDVIVQNDDTLESLYAAVQSIVTSYEVPEGTQPERRRPTVQAQLEQIAREHVPGSIVGVPDEAVAQMPNEGEPRCGAMSRTKRVCTQIEGHQGMHADHVAHW